MKNFMLVSLLSCLVVGQVSCVATQVSSERENANLAASFGIGFYVVSPVPIVFCAAVGSAIASISGLSSRSGLLLGGLFGSLTAGCLGLELIRQGASQDKAKAKKDADKICFCGYGMCAASFFSCLTIACMSNS